MAQQEAVSLTREVQAARRLPVGAELWPGGGVHFRVWAPHRRKVELIFESGSIPPVELQPERERDAAGYFSGHVPEARAGSLYRYRLDEDGPFPDPASRFQPEGPHGPSQVVDPAAFAWTDDAWRGLRPEGQVLYELHIGTFTPEGTWQAAEALLPELAALGITAIELMPVADFPGRFGWGYDGVDLFAPTRLYGSPDDLRSFVNAAHRLSLGVVLDVVYNHTGPDGCYLGQFAPDYYTKRYQTEWGQAINFDGENCGPVREFFLANAAYWIDEFHLDGLRIDATQSIFDSSSTPIITELGRQAREAARAHGRTILLVAENEPQHAHIVQPPAEGGFGLDAVWSEDFHHTAMVALTGRREGYYSDYLGTPQELLSALKWKFLYQGQRYAWQHKRRGTPTFGLPPWAFVFYLQNHDQVANSMRSERLHRMTSPGRYRAMTALFLLAPATPMLFQGQEFAASTPFHYVIDQGGDLGEAVRQGHRHFLGQFRNLAHPEAEACLADPTDPQNFLTSKLNQAERERNREALALHRDLIALRRGDAVFRQQGTGGLEGAVLGPEAFVARYFGAGGDDRLLLVNLGTELRLSPAPEPLLAPPVGRRWELLWSSENPRYGGCGTGAIETSQHWRLPGQCAVVMTSRVVEDRLHAEHQPEPDHLEGERPDTA